MLDEDNILNFSDLLNNKTVINNMNYVFLNVKVILFIWTLHMFLVIKNNAL